MMRALLSLLLLFSHTLICLGVDFDVVVVGTSPISLLEALYRYHSGNSVLILEESAVCGGAWKSIDICGISHVDLGCHTLGHDKVMLNFLEEYVGCKMVSMDNPHQSFEPGRSPNGFYPQKGCYEIIQNLQNLIQSTDIVLLVNNPLESVFIESDRQEATVRTRDMQFTTSKIIVTPYSHFLVDNPLAPTQKHARAKYYHLYMLVEDPVPARFSFRSGVANGVSRLMNLTYFVGLEGSGLQLLVFQTHGETFLHQGDFYLEALKKQGLLDPSARILKSEFYIYEQSHYTQPPNIKNANTIFEMLNTGHIQGMVNYIPKWKQVLKPFHLAISN